MTSFTLKILAVIFMLIDHIGLVVFPKIEILRIIGRLSFPLFAYQIGTGFKHTKSKEKYMLRMLLFTLISQIPFMLVLKKVSAPFLINIGGTFTISLLALYCYEKLDNKYLKYISAFSVSLLSLILPVDYGFYGVLCVLLFYLLRKDKLMMGIAYTILVSLHCYIDGSIFSLPSIFALVFIFMYNGQKGPHDKYLFYTFYPLHLLILSLI